MSSTATTASSPGLEADFEAVAALLASGSRFLLTGHRNPDGDTLGSCLALARALGQQGKDARVVMKDHWASACSWLPGIESVSVSDSLPPDWPEGFAALLVLECPHASRTGFPEMSRGVVVNIDHHPGNALYGTHDLVDVKAAAAGEVVADLLDVLDWPIDEEIATSLWVALVSDTGSFRYSSTTPKALALGARLVAAGVRPGDVNERLFESRPARSVALEALVLGTLALHDGGRVATLEAPARFLEISGASQSDAEGLANRARAIEGVRAAALLSEGPDGISVSLRAKGSVDVRAVAARHGGGGHRAAAGCTLGGTLAEARALVATELTDAVQAAAAAPAPAGEAA